jgi:hypothetical protein
MTWVTIDYQHYRHAIKEIPRQRDRGAGIIAAAIVEDHIQAAIETRLWIHQATEGVRKSLFKGYGPLSSFGAKIDLAYAMGLIPDGNHSLLHNVRLIRNSFAHDMGRMSFRARRELCATLNPGPGSVLAARKMWKLRPDDIKRADFNLFRRSNNPRTQYLRFAQRTTFYFAFIVLTSTSKEWTKKPNEAPSPSLHGISTEQLLARFRTLDRSRLGH